MTSNIFSNSSNADVHINLYLTPVGPCEQLCFMHNVFSSRAAIDLGGFKVSCIVCYY